MPKLPLFFVLLLLLTGGCARNVDGTWKAPLVYRIDIQQGNVVDQQMLDRLKPGMDKNQVKYVMGSPLIQDPFHSNRWDYVYIMEPGQGSRTQRRITLYFEDEKLAYIDGNVKIADRPAAEEQLPRNENSVAVPLDTHKEGFFSNLFGGDEEPAESAAAPSEGEEPAQFPAALSEDEETGTAATETAATGEVTAEELPADEQQALSPEEQKTVTEADESPADTEKKTLADEERDTNLVRRFWDRMTTGAEDSGIQEGKETERDIRDAEVLEKAGGGL